MVRLLGPSSVVPLYLLTEVGRLPTVGGSIPSARYYFLEGRSFSLETRNQPRHKDTTRPSLFLDYETTFFKLLLSYYMSYYCLITADLEL